MKDNDTVTDSDAAADTDAVTDIDFATYEESATDDDSATDNLAVVFPEEMTLTISSREKNYDKIASSSSSAIAAHAEKRLRKMNSPLMNLR